MVVLRRWFLTLVCLGLVVGAAAVAALLAWPSVGVAASPSGLAGISLPGFSGHVERISVTGRRGQPVPIVLRGGTVWPRVRLTPGERVIVHVEISRPSWIGWLVGRSEERTLTVVTPAAHVRSALLSPRRGTTVRVSFDEPVSRVAIGGGRLRRLRTGRSVVPLGVRASGRATTGTTTVAAAVRPWETLPQPTLVSWFVPGARREVVSQPGTGSRISPSAVLTLTFAKPVSAVLGSRLPRLRAGRVRSLGPDQREHALVPGPRRPRPRSRRHRARPAPGADARLEGRARLDVAVAGAARAPRLSAGPLARACGHDACRRGGGCRLGAARHLLVALPGDAPLAPDALEAGRLEHRHRGCRDALSRRSTASAPTGVAGPQVWRALLARRPREPAIGTPGTTTSSCTRPCRSRSPLARRPASILTSPGNTGMRAAPTAARHVAGVRADPIGRMRGTNPDGTKYSDPGYAGSATSTAATPCTSSPRDVRDAQSLGCVELPEEAAAEVWPYTPIGTLVTIES